MRTCAHLCTHARTQMEMPLQTRARAHTHMYTRVHTHRVLICIIKALCSMMPDDFMSRWWGDETNKRGAGDDTESGNGDNIRSLLHMGTVQGGEWRSSHFVGQMGGFNSQLLKSLSQKCCSTIIFPPMEWNFPGKFRICCHGSATLSATLLIGLAVFRHEVHFSPGLSCSFPPESAVFLYVVLSLFRSSACKWSSHGSVCQLICVAQVIQCCDVQLHMWSAENPA